MAHTLLQPLLSSLKALSLVVCGANLLLQLHNLHMAGPLKQRSHQHFALESRESSFQQGLVAYPARPVQTRFKTCRAETCRAEAGKRAANLGSHRAALLLDCLCLGGELFLQPLVVALENVHPLLYFHLPQQTCPCLCLGSLCQLCGAESEAPALAGEQAVNWLAPSLAGRGFGQPLPHVQLRPAWHLHLTRTQSYPAGKMQCNHQGVAWVLQADILESG